MQLAGRSERRSRADRASACVLPPERKTLDRRKAVLEKRCRFHFPVPSGTLQVLSERRDKGVRGAQILGRNLASML